MLMRILNHKYDAIYVCKKEINDRVNFEYFWVNYKENKTPIAQKTFEISIAV